MTQSNGNTSLQDGTDPDSLSPARDALRTNPDAGGDSMLSLKKKKSWFGSLRDVVHKGAKAAVDTFKGDQPKAEIQPEQAESTETETETAHLEDAYSDCNEYPPRKSEDSMTQSLVSSTTPLRGDKDRRPNFISKVASSSLRQHLSSHPSRNKRSSVHSITARPSSEMANRPAIEQLTSISTEQDQEGVHIRKSSVAGSIVGSIRSVGRRAGKAKPTRMMCMKDTEHSVPDMPNVPAEAQPLPSSPIDIPAAAPSLDLDLGPAGFISPTFGRSPVKAQKQRADEAKQLTDPANITTGLPARTPILSTEQTPAQLKRSSVTRSVTPRELLKITIDEVGPSPPPPGPATPMPGTHFALEVDGSNSERSDKSQVFERSVTPSFDKERRDLRKMRSLDAMAEACTVAHANDELVQMAEASESDDSGQLACSSKESRPRPKAPCRDQLSSETAETIHCCPDDMPELTRQQTPEQVSYCMHPAELMPQAKNRDVSVDEDPFDDSNAVKSGPPSPDRSVELPFRFKVDANLREPFDSLKGLDGTNDELERDTDSGEGYILSEASNSPRSQAVQPQRANAIKPEGLEDPFQTVTSEDDIQVRTEQLLASDIVLPNYENIDTTASEGLSPHGGPMMQRILHGINVTPSSSPRSVRSRTTYTAGLGETEFQFSFDTWLRDSSSPAPPDSEPSTPHRRRMDTSLDSVSTTEERKTLAISPTSTSSERTPSMGNRLEFDLKRSERNSRYNALHSAQPAQLGDVTNSSRRGPPQFIVGGSSEEMEAGGIRLANFESAYTESRAGTPQKKDDTWPSRIGREDSVVESLKDAAFDYYQLEERLAGPLPSDDRDVFADPVLSAESSYEFKPPSDPNEFPLASANVESSPLPTLRFTKGETTSPPSADSPSTITGRTSQSRIASSDTLDRSLNLFGSPDSGYQADESSVYKDTSPISKPQPARYRSRGSRRGRPLSEMSNNVA